MPKCCSYGSRNTKCPYFEKDSRLTITCEGMYKDTTVKTEFDTEGHKREFQQKYCFKYPNECFLQTYKNNLYEQQDELLNI